MVITTDRLASLVVLVIVAVLGAMFLWPTGGPLAGGVVTLLIAFPGMLLIWFRDELSQTGFTRGVFRPTYPGLVAAFGWLFLVGLPALFMLAVWRNSLW
jgi:hypothetical protein